MTSPDSCQTAILLAIFFVCINLCVTRKMTKFSVIINKLCPPTEKKERIVEHIVPDGK